MSTKPELRHADTKKRLGVAVTRFEVIDSSGRVFAYYGQAPFDVEVLTQDNARTVKLFVKADMGLEVSFK